MAAKRNSDRTELPSPLGSENLWHEALQLWLRWNEEHDQITDAMFRARRDTRRLAALAERIDQIDQLRWRAVELSQTLLESRRAG